MRSADVARDGVRATVRTGLRNAKASPLGTAVWTLSLDDRRGWLIDAVLVQPETEAAMLSEEAAPPPPPPKKKKKQKAPEREPVARPNPLAAEGAAAARKRFRVVRSRTVLRVAAPASPRPAHRISTSRAPRRDPSTDRPRPSSPPSQARRRSAR